MGWARTDDLDGSPAEQVTFGLEGQAYMVDLGTANLERLRKALLPFVTVARHYDDLPTPPEYPVAAQNGTAPARRGGRPSPATKPGRRRTRRANSGGTPSRVKAPVVEVDHKTIREWARGQGMEVSDRGRIPEAIVEEFRAKHTG